MVLSSYAALNKIGAGNMRELNDYIALSLDSSLNKADVVKPTGLHFVLQDKIFMGTNNPLISCPIQFLLRDQTNETKLCRVVWTERSQRSKVTRKARVGVKKHSVIRLDDFTVVPYEKASTGYLILIRSYQVLKKDVDKDAYHNWIVE
jgi:hypothetical protein